jgi:alpha-beta hydrolase superfamily lysophospholipase
MIAPIVNAHGERLDYTFHPGDEDAKSLVVIGHGVTGHKDRPFLVALAEGIARSGISALRFSFSGNGGSEGRFADSNISKETEDLGAVLDVLAGHELAYAGHSMGGAVGLLRASSDRRISRLISLAGMVHVRNFAERHFANLVPGRDLMWGKPGFLLPAHLQEDLVRLDSLLEPARQISVPWLFVHGTADTIVPLQDTRDAFASATCPKKLVVLEGSDHIWEPAFTPAMVDAVVDFLHETRRRT